MPYLLYHRMTVAQTAANVHGFNSLLEVFLGALLYAMALIVALWNQSLFLPSRLFEGDTPCIGNAFGGCH
jgi:hypothetical protein